MGYGLPYQGSKSDIAADIIAAIPPADEFFDVFAGGCAITHAAILSNKFSVVVANDITDAPTLFTKAIEGKYANEKRWISREDFSRLKDRDAYVRICWSFGNAGQNYMYSREIEPWKKALYYARVLHDFSLMRNFGIEGDDFSRLAIKAHHEEYKQKYIKWWLKQQKYTPEQLEKLIENAKQDISLTQAELRAYLCNALKAAGITQSEVDKRLGTQMSGHYFGASQWAFPTEEYYKQMQAFMPALDKDYNEIYGLYQLRKRLERLESLESLQSLQRLQSLQSLESLESLQRLQRLQSLQSLQSAASGDLQQISWSTKDPNEAAHLFMDKTPLQRLNIRRGDYRKLLAYCATPTIFYCDPPYKETKGYNGEEFDHDAFWIWCEDRMQWESLVLVSEYTAPPCWIPVWQKTRNNKMQSRTNSGHVSQVTEKLFIHETQYEWYLELMRRYNAKYNPTTPKLQQLEFDF